MKRKGIGYVVEIIASLLILFVFVLGNNPEPPRQDLGDLQTDVSAEDLGIALKKSGDIEYFVSNGGTGSLKSTSEALTRQDISVSGTVKNIPLEESLLGFHVLDSDRRNISLKEVDSSDECSGDLEEINNKSEILTNQSNLNLGEPPIYVADTDPGVLGDPSQYDTVYVDNGTSCQFAPSEGPYYHEEFFNLTDGSIDNVYDFKKVHGTDELEIYEASQVVRIGRVAKRRVNNIDPRVNPDTLAAENADLNSYDTIIFRHRDSLSKVIYPESDKLKRYARNGNLLLLMDLVRSDFIDASGSIKDNFLTDTGMKWVDLSYTSPPQKANFTDTYFSGRLETFFTGLYKSNKKAQEGLEKVDLDPGGRISSSNSKLFKQETPILRADQARYDTDGFNTTNYSMEQVDASTVDEPESECVPNTGKSPSLTRGKFDFPTYGNINGERSVLNTELGNPASYCTSNDKRALSIDRNGNTDYTENDEGPFLEKEKVVIKGKEYNVFFPDKPSSLSTGEKAVFNYTGEKSIELVNYRAGFEKFDGARLVRMEYKNNYKIHERKIIAGIIHWMSDDSKSFGEIQKTSRRTETIGGINGTSFVPYRLITRWSR